MATEIDKKIIEMELRNRQFEAASKSTMSTLDRLKEKLNFNNVADSMSRITGAANRVDLSHIERATNSAGRSFDAMAAIAFTALQRMTNAAITAGSRIMNALTIAPVMDGFREYETKMNSIQTILSNTQSRQGKASAKTIADINAQADAAIAAIDDTTSKSSKASTSAKKDSLDALRDLQEEQRYAFEDNLDEQKRSLDKAQDEELKSFEDAHDERMKLYDREYSMKLKLLDKEEADEVSEIDLQIKAIKDQMKAEDEAKKKQSEKDRLSDLQQRVRDADTAEKKKSAEKALADYKKDLAFKAEQDVKKSAISILEDQKDKIEDEYKEKKRLAKEEYNEIKDYINEEHKTKRDEMRETHDMQKEYQTIEHRNKMRDFRKEQEAAMKAAQPAPSSGGGGGGGGSSKKAQLAAIEAERQRKIIEANNAAGMTEASTMEDVTNALNELNKYSDKTIYNFANMTENIGRFTAAGVGLDDSVAAIKGIANVAALSGSNANQAASAMYQLSQALSSGTMTLEDWNSVENSGMGGAILQNELMATARKHGIAVDQMVAKNGSFRMSLQEGWITTEVLMDTFAKFTGDMNEEMLIAQGYTAEEAKRIFALGQSAMAAATEIKTLTQLVGVVQEALGSGWAQTWELIIGDFGTAKELFTNVGTALSDMIGNSADARNELVKGWDDLGGRQVVLDTLLKAFNSFIKVANTIKTAWNNVFPPVTAQTLMNITNGFAKFVDALTLSEDGLSILSSSLEIIFSIMNRVYEVIKDIVSNVAGVFNVSIDTKKIADQLSGIKDTINGLETSELIINGLTGAFDKLQTIVQNFVNTLTNFDAEAVVQKISEGLKELPSKIQALMGDHEAIFTMLGGGAIAAGLAKLIGTIMDAFKGDVGIIDNVSNTFEALTDTLETFQSSIKANMISTVAKSVLMLAGALFMLSLLDQEALAQGLVSVTLLITALSTAMVVMGKMTGSISMFQEAGGVTASSISKQASFFGIAAGLLAMATAVGILAVAAGILSLVPIEETLASIASIMFLLVTSAIVLSKFAPAMLASSAGVLAISVALGLLVAPLTILGLLPIDIITQGLLAIAGLMLTMAIFTKLINKADLLATSVGLIAVAIAIGMMSTVLTALGLLVIPAAIGLAVLIPLLLALAGTVKLLDGKAVGAAGLLAIGAALMMMSNALIGIITAIALVDDPFTIIYALVTIGALLVGMVTAATALSGLGKASGGLISMAVALNLMGTALLIVSNIDNKKIFASLAALTGLIAVMTLASTTLTGAASGALSMLAMAGALTAVALAFGIVSLVNLDNIWGFIGAYSALTAVALAAGAAAGIPTVAAGLAALTTSLVGISSSAALFAAACMGIATSILLLAKLGSDGANSLMDALETFVKRTPGLFDKLVTAVIEGVKIFNKRLPEIVEEVINMTTTIVTTLIGAIPQMLEAGAEILSAILTPLIDGVVTFAPIAWEFICELVKGITEGLVDIGKAGLGIVVAITTAIKNGITEHVPKLIQSMIGVGKDLVNGVINGITSMVTNLTQKVKNLGTSILNTMKDVLNINSPSKITYQYGRWFDEGLMDGIDKDGGLVEKSSKELGLRALKGIDTALNTNVDSFTPTIAPVLDLDKPINDINLFKTSMDTMRMQSAKMEGVIHNEQVITLSIEANKPIRVEGINNEKELIAVQNTFLDERKLTQLIRRELRL